MSTVINHRPFQVSPVGDLDLEGGDDLEGLIVPMLAPGMRVSIDLSGVGFADSSGLGALIAIEQVAREQGAHLTLSNPSESVRQLLTMTGLTDFFAVDIR